MTKKRQPCVRAYRRSGRPAEIQHQLPPTGVICPIAVATILVTAGINQMAMQLSSFLFVERVGAYSTRVTVRSVTTAMARMEKSAACTESWPTSPLTTHAALGRNSRWLMKMAPEMELLSELMNSYGRHHQQAAERGKRGGAYRPRTGSKRAHDENCAIDDDIQ